MTIEVLSRIQFALTISFHFLFPPMTIGLGLVLVIFQTLRLTTGDPLYLNLARFWTKVFGLIFAIGVATGIPMEFQFGTNWAHYARFVGDIFGSPLAIEGIYAFFLESGFLALLLFGWEKVGPRMHLFSTGMVALGAHFSAIWILVANSWMQTPAGYHLARQMKVTPDGTMFRINEIVTGPFEIKEIALPTGYVVQPEDLGQVRAVIDSFSEAIFNPSTLDRLAHTIFACWMTGAFLVVSISAWWLLKGRFIESARASLRIGLSVAMFACILQMVAADSTARGVAKHQPTKLAAIEGLATSTREASLGLFGYVTWKRDVAGKIIGIEEHTVRIPGLLSLLVSGDYLHPFEAVQSEVKGLGDLPSDEFLRMRHPGSGTSELAALRPNYWPQVPVVFQTYHLMITLGVILTILAGLGCLLAWRGLLWRVESKLVRLFLGMLACSVILCQLACQAGWFTAELGRQPWVVYGVLKTGEAISSVLRPPQVLSSIIMFSCIYILLTMLFLMLLRRIVHAGPPTTAEVPDTQSKKWQLFSLKGERQTKE